MVGQQQQRRSLTVVGKSVELWGHPVFWVLFAWTSVQQQLKEQQEEGEVPKSLGGKFLQHSWIMEGIIFGVSKGLLANLLLQTSIVYIFFPNNRGFKRAVNPSEAGDTTSSKPPKSAAFKDGLASENFIFRLRIF